MIFWVRSKPTWVRLIYSMEQQHWRTGRLQSKKTTVKTDMLRSIGKQSGESVESVCIWSRYTGCWNMCTWMGVKWDAWTVASMPLCDWCRWRCVTGCRNFIRASGRVMSMAFGCATRRECHCATVGSLKLTQTGHMLSRAQTRLHTWCYYLYSGLV